MKGHFPTLRIFALQSVAFSPEVPIASVSSEAKSVFSVMHIFRMYGVLIGDRYFSVNARLVDVGVGYYQLNRMYALCKRLDG